MRKVFGRSSKLLALTLFFAATILPSLPQASAQNGETWFDQTSQPTLEASWSTPSITSTNGFVTGWNPPCQERKVLQRQFKIGLPIWQQYITRCWYGSAFGLMGVLSQDYVLGDGSIVAGKITNMPAGSFQSAPHDAVLFKQTNGAFSFIYNPQIHANSHPLGTVSYTIDWGRSFSPKKADGNPVNASLLNHVNYSRSGEWAVMAIQHLGLVRMNMRTNEILNFGEPIPHGPGWNPYMKISITEDGRYAVAAGTASAGGQWMRIYDLASCQDTAYEYVKTPHANCKYRDLTQFIAQSIPNFNRFTMAEFGDSDTLVFYHKEKDGQSFTRYVMRAPGADKRVRSYLALGDSFASGEGAHNYFEGTDEGEKLNNCHLSKNSYPYLIGDWLKLDNYRSVACSGAVARNVNGPESLIDGKLNKSTDNTRTNQYLKDVPGNELGEWMPGYYPQLHFIGDNMQPDVITISMIGNDIGFSDKIFRCLMPDTCYNTYEDRLEILREVRSKFDTLTDLYRQLLDAGGANTKLYVIGYPKIGNESGSCALNVWLNAAELKFANLLAGELNSVIRQATIKAGASYVDVEDSLAGFRFCEADGSQISLNGVTAGNDLLVVIGNESYHPNIRGQRLFAEAILRETDNFNRPMPAPSFATTAPSQETGLEFLNQPPASTVRPIYSTNYNAGLSEEVIYKDALTPIHAENEYKNRYQPYSLVDLYIYSTPLKLATYTADGLGIVGGEFEIPGSVPVGFHTLHLLGKDLYGNPIDTYRTVYVAHSEQDKNGNGISDADEACGVFNASGQDVDQDGTDDACDPLISSPPQEETLEEQPSKTAVPTDPGQPPGAASQLPNQDLAYSPVLNSGDVLSSDDAKSTKDTLAKQILRIEPGAEEGEKSRLNLTALLAGIVVLTLTIALLIRYSRV